MQLFMGSCLKVYEELFFSLTINTCSHFTVKVYDYFSLSLGICIWFHSTQCPPSVQQYYLAISFFLFRYLFIYECLQLTVGLRYCHATAIHRSKMEPKQLQQKSGKHYSNTSVISNFHDRFFYYKIYCWGNVKSLLFMHFFTSVHSHHYLDLLLLWHHWKGPLSRVILAPQAFICPWKCI